MKLKNLKKFFIILIMTLLSFTFFQEQTSAKATTTYNAQKALSYAENYWNVDAYSILCAEFVSNCLSAGGIPITQNTSYGIHTILCNNNYATEYKLNTTTVGDRKRVKFSDNNSSHLVAGDVILWRCTNPECMKIKNGWKHSLLYSGVVRDDYICAYAHNDPHDADDIMSCVCCTCDKCDDLDIYVMHMNPSSISSSNTKTSTVSATSVKNFKSIFVVKTSNKPYYSQPYTSSTKIGSLTTGDRVAITGYLYNKNGNLWYRTKSGYYISCSYLYATSNNAPSDYMNKTFECTATSKGIFSVPYGVSNGRYKSVQETSLKKGQKIKIIGKLTNYFDNTWYITSSGSYICSTGGLKTVD